MALWRANSSTGTVKFSKFCHFKINPNIDVHKVIWVQKLYANNICIFNTSTILDYLFHIVKLCRNVYTYILISPGTLNKELSLPTSYSSGFRHVRENNYNFNLSTRKFSVFLNLSASVIILLKFFYFNQPSITDFQIGKVTNIPNSC